MTKKGSDIFARLTPEKKEAIKKRMLEHRASLTLAYQLGHYVGEEIVRKFLPTLSVDSIHTRTNISVTCAEGDECRRLDNIWFNKTMEFHPYDEAAKEATKKEWDESRAYHEMLEEKYLPKTVECHLRCLNITEENMKEFKEAIGHVLWNCDCSHYSTKPEDIDVKADEDGYFTIITLKKS